MKSILVLGAGHIARPCVQYLLRFEEFQLTVVDLLEENIEKATANHPRSRKYVLNRGIAPESVIESLAPNLVICLLPPEYMISIARACLCRGIHLVHPTYLNEGMKALGADVKRSGLVFIAEMGLDPGIDHMLAARAIRNIHGSGGLVESFRSVCGALPSPESNNNPWGYKLSWDPETLIGASKRTARARLDGRNVTWPDGEAYEKVSLGEIEGLGWFEVYANADSIPYIEKYGIPEVGTIFRGTLRYPGWCETICKMNDLQLVEEEVQNLEGMTFRQFMAQQAGALPGEDAEEAVCRRLGIEPYSTVFLRFKWLGLFDDTLIPLVKGSSRDVIASLFKKNLVYEAGEKDLVILRDEFLVSYPHNGEKKIHVSLLVESGTVGKETAIARTTGLPVGITARLVLEQKINTPGLHIPTVPDIFDPVLLELAREGLVPKEESKYII